MRFDFCFLVYIFYSYLIHLQILGFALEGMKVSDDEDDDETKPLVEAMKKEHKKIQLNNQSEVGFLYYGLKYFLF